MKRALLLFVAVVTLDGFASEVDASNPQLASLPQLAAVIVETGVSDRWIAQATIEQASKRKIQKFEKRVGRLDNQLKRELDSLVAEKLDALLARQEY